MKMSKLLSVAIIGCGNIAKPYLQTLMPQKEKVSVRGLADLDVSRAQALAKEFETKAYATPDEAIRDPQVDVIVNLTAHTAHYDVIKHCLAAGKHVYSEKPLALTYAKAAELCDIAERNNLHLCGAPMTFMGDAQQCAIKALRDGRAGNVKVIYAEMNHGRIESWHPAPVAFYSVGPLWDVGVYPLTFLAASFGRFSRVLSAGSRQLLPDRSMPDGKKFSIEAPDWFCAVLEMEAGPIVRLTTNFFVAGNNTEQKSRIEFHGDSASLVIDNPFIFDANVRASKWNEPLAEVPPLRAKQGGIEWGRALVELADAIEQKRKPRTQARMAAHVVEVIESINKCAADGKQITLKSEFEIPPLMEWAK
jgi:predicted dehydrogenase